MNHACLRITIVVIGLPLAALATLTVALPRDADKPAADPLAPVIAREELRLAAARASLDAKPLIGRSQLPPFDSKAAIAREEETLRQLSSARSGTR